jgi:hypothetical protein
MTSNIRHDIDFAPLLAGLEQPLQLVSEPERRQELQTFVNAARPQVERAAFDLLSQTVTAFNDASRDQRARLEYSDGGLHLIFGSPSESSDPEPAFDDSELDKVTLRLPKELKQLIDHAAGRHGISANNWYVRELSRTIARHVRDSVRDASREERHESRRRGFNRARGGSLRGIVGGDHE